MQALVTYRVIVKGDEVAVFRVHDAGHRHSEWHKASACAAAAEGHTIILIEKAGGDHVHTCDNNRHDDRDDRQ